MTTPIGSHGMPQGGAPKSNNPNVPPMGPPLPPDSPWVKSLAKLFPNVPPGEIMMWAGKFRDNMFSALNNEVKRMTREAKEAARKFKESIED